MTSAPSAQLASELDRILDAGSNQSNYWGVEKAMYHLGLTSPMSRAVAGGVIAALLINFFQPAAMSDEDGRILWLQGPPGKVPAALGVLAGAAAFGVFL
jgi:hypothetical protein